MFNTLTTKAFAKVASAKTYMQELSRRAEKDMASDKKGQAILEYGILFVAVGLGLVLAVTKLKNTIAQKLDEAGNEINKNVKSN